MTGEDEIASLILGFQPIKVSDAGPYTPLDKYRDYRAVFGTPAGQRVLSLLINESDRVTHEDQAKDHALLVWRAAQRRMLIDIIKVMRTPPREAQ